MSQNKQNSSQITVQDNIVGSIYSQLVTVSVTDIDMTLEFAYINPREKNIGKIVSRVTLPRPVGENLAKIILQTVKIHEETKKRKKDATNIN